MARIGVVLSSGGGRGVYGHTGFLLALEKLGIDINAISGCSAGAVVGGVAASGADLHHWSEVIANIKTQEYWTPESWPRFLWKLTVNKGRGYTGISDTTAAVEFCRRNLAVQRFEDCRIPLHVLATNLGSGAKTLFAEGELAPRIMASAAMPVLYRPVEIDGEMYCDGAAMEFAPTEALCCRHKLDAVIVHHTAVHRDGQQGLRRALDQPWSMVEILYLLIYRHRPWYLSDQPLTIRACQGGCGVPIIVVEPQLPELVWPLSNGGPQVQAAAMAQVETMLGPYAEVLLSDPGKLHQIKNVSFN